MPSLVNRETRVQVRAECQAWGFTPEKISEFEAAVSAIHRHSCAIREIIKELEPDAGGSVERRLHEGLMDLVAGTGYLGGTAWVLLKALKLDNEASPTASDEPARANETDALPPHLLASDA